MYYFRMFELNINAMPPLFSILHTGNFVYDGGVAFCLQNFKAENRGPFAFYDNTNDSFGSLDEAEEVGKQDPGNM